jgi:hypothetical protein
VKQQREWILLEIPGILISSNPYLAMLKAYLKIETIKFIEVDTLGLARSALSITAFASNQSSSFRASSSSQDIAS